MPNKLPKCDRCNRQIHHYEERSAAKVTVRKYGVGLTHDLCAECTVDLATFLSEVRNAQARAY